jgi:hypothetical protein
LKSRGPPLKSGRGEPRSVGGSDPEGRSTGTDPEVGARGQTPESPGPGGSDPAAYASTGPKTPWGVKTPGEPGVRRLAPVGYWLIVTPFQSTMTV